MTTFYICRHGQTENNKNERLSGWIDTPLTREGINNTASSAAKLSNVQFDKIISSDLGRAFVTAYLISRRLGYSSDIESFKGLREVNYGDLANMPISEVIAASLPLNKADYIPLNGESLAQMQQRVMDCLAVISRDNPDKTIVLVGHDGTINATYASFANIDISIADSTRNAYDFVAEFVYDNGKIVSFDEVVV